MKTRIIFLAAAWLGAASLSAHDTWLMPERFSATPGATLKFDLTSASGFSGPESAIKPDRVERALFRLGAELSDLTIGAPTEKTLVFITTFSRPGVAVVAVDLKPKILELGPDKIEVYFREIHAGEALRKAWLAVREPRRWRERYAKHTKTFVRIGEPKAEDSGWAQPVGAALEIIPERNPTILKVGDALSVRVLRGFVAEGEVREHVAFTDSKGQAKAVLDAPGVWLIHGTDLRRVVSDELEWESDFVTMTVDVR
jgi:uncharacterized GH25 family protein